MFDFNQELSRKVSIDEKKVSLNALELFTRDKGMDKGVHEIALEAILKQKAKRSVHLNDTIVKELEDLKRMLETKSRQLNLREQELKAKENGFDQLKQRALNQIREEFAQMMKEGEGRINKAYQEVAKKNQIVERNIQNKLKLVQQKDQQLS